MFQYVDPCICNVSIVPLNVSPLFKLLFMDSLNNFVLQSWLNLLAFPGVFQMETSSGHKGTIDF